MGGNFRGGSQKEGAPPDGDRKDGDELAAGAARADDCRGPARAKSKEGECPDHPHHDEPDRRARRTRPFLLIKEPRLRSSRFSLARHVPTPMVAGIRMPSQIRSIADADRFRRPFTEQEGEGGVDPKGGDSQRWPQRGALQNFRLPAQDAAR